jgi:tetratricopeptide (TPR) repeat protein
VKKSVKIALCAMAVFFSLASLIAGTIIYFGVSFYQAHKSFNEGVVAMFQRDYETAIPKFRAALTKHFQKIYRAYALGDLAYCEQATGHCDDAIRDYTAALKLDSTLAWVYENRGWLYDESDRLDAAWKDFSEAIRLDPNMYHAHFKRGLIELERKDIDGAIDDFSEAARIDPSSAVAYYQRGVGYSEKKDYDRALASLDAAIGMNPNYVNALGERGFVCFQKSELDKAIADLSKAIRLSPRYQGAYRTRGFVFKDQKHWKEAISDFNRALQLNSKDTLALEGRGATYSSMGERDRAIADFTTVLQIWNVPHIYDRRGCAYYLKGDYDRAIADFREGLKSMPDDGSILNNLAWFLATCPDPKFRNGDEAVTVAMKACTVTRWREAFYVDTLAAAYAEANRFSEAIAYQTKALSYDTLDSAKIDEMKKRRALYEQHKPFRQTITAKDQVKTSD